MKASYHNGRATKAGNVYNANHNTKIETRENQKHINHERTLENVVWARDINNPGSKKLIRQEGSFDARAMSFNFTKTGSELPEKEKTQNISGQAINQTLEQWNRSLIIRKPLH